MRRKFVNLALGCLLLGAIWVAIDFFMHASHNYVESFLTGAIEWIFLSIVFAFLDRAIELLTTKVARFASYEYILPFILLTAKEVLQLANLIT